MFCCPAYSYFLLCNNSQCTQKYTSIILRLVKQPSKWSLFFSDIETGSRFDDKLALKSQFSCLGFLSGETTALYHHAQLVISLFLFRWMFPSFSSFAALGLYELRCNDNTFKAMIWCCSVESYNPSSVLHKRSLDIGNVWELWCQLAYWKIKW